MMNEIKCGVCHKVIAYTNRKISDTKKDFLFSTKISEARKWSMICREKLIYCVDCYNEGIAKGTADIMLERQQRINERDANKTRWT